MDHVAELVDELGPMVGSRLCRDELSNHVSFSKLLGPVDRILQDFADAIAAMTRLLDDAPAIELLISAHAGGASPSHRKSQHGYCPSNDTRWLPGCGGVESVAESNTAAERMRLAKRLGELTVR